MKKLDLPKRCFEKNGAVYLVVTEGKKRKWMRLCAAREGLPGVYKALATLTAAEVTDDRMPSLVKAWRLEISSTHSEKTQENDAYQCREVSKGFEDFRASQVKTSDVIKFLQQFRAMPRTHNAYRSLVRELMRYAETKDMREPGSNPVDSIKTMPLPARTRYITDSELRRIKVAAVYGKDGKRTRSGLMICALIDLAYLTGQRIGDLLSLRWSQITKAGIMFEPSKVAGSTGVRVFIEMSPKLSALVDRLKALKRKDITPHVVTRQNAQPFTYYGASTAWRRAVKRAGVAPVHFHDIRAKALTDVDDVRGMRQAQRMGGHSTQAQTADYVRHKTARKTGATR